MLGFFQEKFIFYPQTLAPDFKFQFNSPFEERTVKVGHNNVNSLLFKADNPKGLILYFHGNAGSLESWGHAAREIVAQTNWQVWILDYPGYGKSDGSISSEKQLHQIAAAFYSAAAAEFPGAKIVPYGRSIGSGLALKLAVDNPVAGVILESPYLSLKKLAKVIFPWAPLFLLKYNFPNEEWIKSVRGPIYIVHGDRDEIIPYEQGKALGVSAKSFVTVPGGGHNDLSSHELYWFQTKAFLSQL